VKTHHLKTDVVIMGGGLAGLNAAIAAAERGVKVVILDKGKIERSGNIAGGVDHFMAYLETGEPWDTREALSSLIPDIFLPKRSLTSKKLWGLTRKPWTIF